VVPVNIHADGAALTGLAALAASGKLTLRVAGTYPLADAARAHERLEVAGVRGRLVLVPRIEQPRVPVEELAERGGGPALPVHGHAPHP
jgi:hypothetical protein